MFWYVCPVKLNRFICMFQEMRPMIHKVTCGSWALTWASNLTRISLLFQSRPMILTLRYGSFHWNLVPLVLLFVVGEIRPGSRWPYICGSQPFGLEMLKTLEKLVWWGSDVGVMSHNPHMPSLMHFRAELHVRHLFPMLSSVFPTNSEAHWSLSKLQTSPNKLRLSFGAFSLDPALLSLSFLLYLLSLFLWSENHVPQPPMFHPTHLSMFLLVL